MYPEDLGRWVPDKWLMRKGLVAHLCSKWNQVLSGLNCMEILRRTDAAQSAGVVPWYAS